VRFVLIKEGTVKLVIVESPYAGDIETHKAYLVRCLRDSLERGEAPYASHGLYTNVLNDEVPEERRMGINAGFAWRAVADFTAFYCDYGESLGMKDARMSLKAHGFVIRYIGRNP
jgi:hypothetical protein